MAIGTVVAARVRQMFCGLHGHDNLLQFERDRMFLRCVSCGHESPGWEMTETPPTVTEVGDASRHAIVRPPLVGHPSRSRSAILTATRFQLSSRA